MDGMITFLNATGKSFVEFSTSMLIQSSVLIIILLVLDVLLRKRVRVTFLYGIWMLALVKLVLPTTLSSPVGLGYWFGDKVPGIVAEKAFSIPSQIASALQRAEGVGTMMPYGINITDLSAADISPEPLAATSGRLTAAASPATNSLSWQGFIFLGWSTVVIAMVLLLVRRMFFVRGLLAQSKNPNDSMVSIFERCRRQMAVRGPIFLRLCPLAVSPSVCGIFRPTILIPRDLSRKLKAEDLRSILLHELAHIKRGDVWISLIQTILQIAYFYNPLLWLANGIIRKVREQAVDEMVLVALGEQAEDYPQTLLNISRMTFGRPTLSLRLIGVVESRKALERRIVTMLSRPVPKSSRLGYLRLITIVVIGAMLLPMGRNAVAEAANAQENSRGNSETKTIVPGLRVGDYTLDMSKDEVLRKLGEPESIQLGEDEIVRRGQEKYTLNNLPREYIMAFGDVSFFIHEDSAQGIFVRSPLYKLSNGLGVGDSEQKIKQAFGEDFQLEKVLGKDLLCYHAKGLGFQIHKKNRTVAEIVVYQPQGERDAPDQTEHPKHAIVPGVRVGDYTLDVSKDEVLKKLGEPETIQLGEDGINVVHRGEERYSLNNLPRHYILSFGNISFWFEDGSLEVISVRSPLYKLRNGLKVGDSEQKIKQVFGDDFNLKEILGKNFLCYRTRGIGFGIHKENQTVSEIVIAQPEGVHDARDQQEHSKQTIVPGVGVGDYTLGMSKQVLNKLGQPEGMSFGMDDGIVKGITVHSPLYKFTNGLGVGDSEQKIKQAFGDDFNLKDAGGIKDFLTYEDKGLMFEIHKGNRTVMEINVYQPTGDHGDSDAPGQQDKSWRTIVPGLGVGDYTLGMSKDEVEVLSKSGKPEGMYFVMGDGVVKEITVHSPLYKFTNGLGVGDSEEKIKPAFGHDFQFDEYETKDLLTYKNKGLQFKIHKESGTIEEITITQTQKISAIMLSDQPPGPITFPKIDRHPAGGDFGRGALESLPRYNPKSTENWQVDLRGRDVSGLDLRKSLDDLLCADFDSRTTWPTADRMPAGFDQERIMELGKNPGLGVRKVHERGITGRGIGIAIVDQPLLTKHKEYADRLRLYEENNIEPESDDASMHGAAVASIAVGKTVGVAPDADLYYIGSWTGDRGKGEGGFEWNFAYYAQAVRRILDINKQLPDDRKIRVISMSVGWSPKQKGYDEMTAAVEEAKKAGMLVVCSCIDDVHGFVFDGLGRAPLSDPDDFVSCEPGLWLAKGFYRGQRKWNQLWVPMDSRTTAAPNGINEYVFYRQGGWSWAIPYVAGVYALAAQVDPEITPERFWKLAMKTGRTVEVEHQGKKYELGPIADPGALISSLEDN